MVDHRADVVEPLDVQAVASRGVGGGRLSGRLGLTFGRWPREASAVVDRAGVVEPLDAGKRGGVVAGAIGSTYRP